jgi:hypothetical protein
VRQVGETLGLARTPRVVFVEAAVSPMIWCGLRPLLVLPTSLWRTLDEDSRRAVLVHELAHVRRWDHVLCWLEAIVGAVYWWHPVVWWARRRLHEEAEASCDAWVTALFPSARRAYASALVVTKSFVSTRAQTRGPWLGVASGSAKRLARRITMVMTHKAAPKVSIFGVFATALVIATGAFVMPGLACPPEDEEAKAKTPHANSVVAVKAQNGVAPKAASKSDSGVTFFGEAPALEAMKGQPTPPTPPTAPTAPTAPMPARAPKAPKPPVAVMSAPALAQPTQPAPPAMVDLEALKEGRTPREYQLSPGKLEAFYGMMSRNDIPIFVEMSDDHIVIWGTDDEHAVFGKFIKIVDGNAGKPRGTVAAGGTPFAKAEAERASAAGNRAAAARDREAAQKAREEAQVARELAADQRNRNADLAEQQRALEQSARSLRSRSDALQSESRTTEQRVRDLERLVVQMEERAQRIEQQLNSQDPRQDAPKPAKPRKNNPSPGMMSPTPEAPDAAPGVAAPSSH